MDATELMLGQLNLVVKNMTASVAFYRKLGLHVEPAANAEWAPHHATAMLPNQQRLELDSQEFAQCWNPAFKAQTKGAMAAVLFFYVPSRAAVDSIIQKMSRAGYPVQKTPEDAFWGARYAIIEDPDGNSVGIMSPIDPVKRHPPPYPPWQTSDATIPR